MCNQIGYIVKACELARSLFEEGLGGMFDYTLTHVTYSNGLLTVPLPSSKFGILNPGLISSIVSCLTPATK